METIDKLKKEKAEIASRIIELTNELYFGNVQAQDLVRDQLEAMDMYLQAIDARIVDMEASNRLAQVLEVEGDEKCSGSQSLAECYRRFDTLCDQLEDAIDNIFITKDHDRD